MRRAKKEILRKIQGGQICQLVACMARLGVAELLKDQGASAETLADSLGVPEQKLGRFLKVWVAMRLLTRDEEGFYHLDEEGALLLKDHPESVLQQALYKGSPLVWEPLAKMDEALKGDRSPFELAHGEKLFDYIETHPEEAELFHQSMGAYAKASSDKILDLFVFNEIESILDVGGGNGSFLKGVLERAPRAKGTLFDLPQAIREAKKELPHPRLSYAVGSFFDEIPGRHDLVVLRNILHDWDDERCVTILKKAREAGKQLMVIETVIDPSPESKLGCYADLTLFVTTECGRERTLEEFQSLFDQAALKLEKVTQTTGAKALLLLTPQLVTA